MNLVSQTKEHGTKCVAHIERAHGVLFPDQDIYCEGRLRIPYSRSWRIVGGGGEDDEGM